MSGATAPRGRGSGAVLAGVAAIVAVCAALAAAGAFAWVKYGSDDRVEVMVDPLPASQRSKQPPVTPRRADTAAATAETGTFAVAGEHGDTQVFDSNDDGRVAQQDFDTNGDGVVQTSDLGNRVPEPTGGPPVPTTCVTIFMKPVCVQYQRPQQRGGLATPGPANFNWYAPRPGGGVYNGDFRIVGPSSPAAPGQFPAGG